MLSEKPSLQLIKALCQQKSERRLPDVNGIMSDLSIPELLEMHLLFSNLHAFVEGKLAQHAATDSWRLYQQTLH